MRRSHTPSPVLGLLLGIGVLFLIGILLIYGGQQRIAEELARIAEAQGISAPKATALPPCQAPTKKPNRSGGNSFFEKTKQPQLKIQGSTIIFETVPTQK